MFTCILRRLVFALLLLFVLFLLRCSQLKQSCGHLVLTLYALSFAAQGEEAAALLFGVNPGQRVLPGAGR